MNDSPVAAPARAKAPGIGFVFGALIASLLWSLGTTIGFWTMARGALESVEALLQVSLVGNILITFFTVVALIAFAGGRKGTTAHVAAWVAAVASALPLITMAAEAFQFTRGLDSRLATTLFLVEYVLFLVGEVALWVALTRTRPVARAISIVFYTALGLPAILVVAQTVLPHEAYFAFMRSDSGSVVRVVRMVVSTTRAVVVLVVVWQVMRGGGVTGVSPTGEAVVAVRSSPGRDAAVGAAWLIGGLVVTALSYSMAGGGGRYIITTGAIVYGAARLIRGLVRMGSTSAGTPG